jgi:hypothetical protein
MNTDLRFAPVVALLSGLVGGLLGVVATHGWNVLWPLLGTLGLAGLVWLTILTRRDGVMPFCGGALATTLLTTSVVGAAWGLVSRSGI